MHRIPRTFVIVLSVFASGVVACSLTAPGPCTYDRRPSTSRDRQATSFGGCLSFRLAVAGRRGRASSGECDAHHQLADGRSSRTGRIGPG